MKVSRIISSVVWVLALLASVPMHAETVSQKEAMNLANIFFNTLYGEVSGRPKLIWNGRELTTNRLFTPFYVYNHPKGGFVAISAENKAFPILAYSRNQRFDKSQLGEKEREQFLRYAREIELIRYDSRPPARALEAWQHIPDYLTKTIENPYDSPEFRALTEEAQTDLETMDRRNSWILLPSAVEFEIYDPERYRTYNLDDVLAEEEIPFKFFEDFLNDIDLENRTRAEAYERMLHNPDPVVEYLGGAHLVIRLPGEARLMRAYSMQGQRMLEKYYNNTNDVNIDLSGLPLGFYAILVLGSDGEVYGFKVKR